MNSDHRRGLLTISKDINSSIGYEGSKAPVEAYSMADREEQKNPETKTNERRASEEEEEEKKKRRLFSR